MDMRKLNLKSSVIISYVVIFLIICTSFYIYKNNKDDGLFIDIDYENIVWERKENAELGISFDYIKKDFLSEDRDDGTISMIIPIGKTAKYDRYNMGYHEIRIYSQKNTILIPTDPRSTDIVEQDIFPEFDKEITKDKYKTDTRMTIYEGDLEIGHSLKGFYRKENRFVGLTQSACNYDSVNFTNYDFLKLNPDRTRKQTENCRKIFNHILDSIKFL